MRSGRVDNFHYCSSPDPHSSRVPQIVVESKPGLRYRAWRKPLRKGLYVYRSSTTIIGVSPREVRAFHLDDGLRYGLVPSAG